MILIPMLLCWLIFCQNLFAHEVNYQVKEAQGVCVGFFFASGEPMNYAEVEVYAPNENIVFQKARTDKNGIFCFMPDKAGTWKIITKGETEHGMHGAQVEIKVKEDLSLEGFKKPLVATYTKFFIALGVVGWLVGFVVRERALFIICSTLAVATATSVCGIIGWVGLMAPHLIRMMIGPDHKVLLPLSLCGGGAFMIAADTLSRTITSFDIPVGIITALTGAPFFIYLMKKGGKEAWGKIK